MRFKLRTYPGIDQGGMVKVMYPTNFLKRVLIGKRIIRCAHLKTVDGKTIHRSIHLDISRFISGTYKE